MKKTYISPANKVVTLDAAENLLSESNYDGLATTLSDEVVEDEDYIKGVDNKSLWNSEW